MKKNLTFVIITLVIVGAAWYLNRDQGPATVVNLHPVTENHPDPENGTFLFDTASVTLHNGEASVPVGGSITEDTQLTDVRGYGDLNGDGEEDAAAIIAQSGGGSGTFIYLVAYVSGPVRYKGTNAIFIGDRVDPQSISIKGATITVHYLDRGPDEPLAADPTIPTVKTFTYDPVTQSIDQSIE